MAAILPAELERAGDEPLGAGDGDAPAGGDAAGEDDEVDALGLDERAADVAAALHELKEAVGSRPAKSEATRAPARGVTSLGLKSTALPARSAGIRVRSGIATG